MGEQTTGCMAFVLRMYGCSDSLMKSHGRLQRTVPVSSSMVNQDLPCNLARYGRNPVFVRQSGHLLRRHHRLEVFNFKSLLLYDNKKAIRYLTLLCHASPLIHTSPTPFSEHHSPKVPRRISPRTRKSNGTGFGKDRALFTSCES